MIQQESYPFSPVLNLYQNDVSTLTTSLQSYGTVTGTLGSTTLTCNVSISSLFIGQEIIVNGSDTYTVSSLSGSFNIITTSSLVSNYSNNSLEVKRVSAENDRTGNKNIITQEILTDQPSLVSKAINNKAMLGYNNSLYNLLLTQNSTINGLFENGGTLACVVRAKGYGATNNGRIIDCGEYLFFLPGATNLINFTKFASVSSYVFTYPFSLNTNYIILLTYDQRSPSTPPGFYINSTTSLTPTSTAGSGTATNNYTDYYIGNRAAKNRGWNGFIGNMMFWKKVLTQKQIQSVMKNLGNIYGIQIS